MVRLVFRPYTQVGRPICTSGPLRASTRVSSGFALPRHSSPSFGSYRARSCSTSPTGRARRAGGAPGTWGGPGSHLGRRAPAFTFIAPRGFERALRLARALDSLVRVSRRVGWVADIAADLLRAGKRGPVPALAARRGRVALRTVRPGRRPRRGRGGPVPPAPERGGRAQRGTWSAAPGSGEVRARGRCRARGRSREPPSSPDPSRPTQSRSRRTAAEEMRPAGSGRRGGRSPRPGGQGGSSAAARPSLLAGLNPPGGLRGPHPFTSQRFHVLLNSLFKVLFNFPLRYLSAIGLVPVFSLRWSLPPALGCVPKQPDSEKTEPRRDGGRYRPRTVHGLSLDQEDSGPPSRAGQGVFRTPHVPRPPDGRGFGAGLFPLRSPLLRESWLVSFPPLSNMLKFSGSSRLI
ncbi:translation initiation factor IF-2-like [Nematolebias whitei]|uniref:translation initiation factor IF-2-like n=1 Tax=Nematolebias whitei TaxID=451745 RepID=UPI001898CEDE|nr:translation initiation factor IF-2-like [Nematolebias whitei]